MGRGRQGPGQGRSLSVGLAKGGSGRDGLAGGVGAERGFCKPRPRDPGAVLEGRAEQGSGRPSRPVAAGSRLSQGESPALSSSQSGCPEPGGVLH